MIKQLVSIFAPVLYFSKLENFFPIPVDSWLTHASSEKWKVPFSADRGTAIVQIPFSTNPPTMADLNVLAGSHAPAGGPISISDNTDPNFIGNFLRNADPTNNDMFIDFGGWNPPGNVQETDFTGGARDYIAAFYSSFNHLMQSTIPVEAVPPTKNPPMLPTQPACYVEAEWAGLYPRMDLARVQADSTMSVDFPPAIGDGSTDATAITDLDPYLALSFYFFYPLTDLPPNPQGESGPAVLLREGQWEAITLYFKGTRTDATDDQGRPQIRLPDNVLPSWAVYSQGIQHSDQTPLPADCRPWEDGVEYVGPPSSTALPGPFNAPAVYVSCGTHKNFFDPVMMVTGSDQTVPNPDLLAASQAIAAIGGACVGGGLPGIIIAAILLIIALILFIIAEIDRTQSSSTSDPLPAGPQLDLAAPGGPASSDSSSVPNATNTVNFTMKLINRFSPPQGEQADPDCLPPIWWDFIGRWGVRVASLPSSTWDNGSRRVDQFGRSRAYWNTVALVQYWAEHPEANP
ncbi:hypothetical protein [Burkholderia ubonensis]|uniref:hypothetical protein n=1 Tax=Burkholderia ubonensis TaxID=101571 RepID=UPI0012F95383|nr:hypothetical protein [Burkholderia ubonensis]